MNKNNRKGGCSRLHSLTVDRDFKPGPNRIGTGSFAEVGTTKVRLETNHTDENEEHGKQRSRKHSTTR